MSKIGTEPPQKTRPWVKIAFAISLALNLAVVGIIAGAIVRHGGQGELARGHASISAFGAPYMRALSKPQRREIGQEVRQALGPAVPDRRARRAAFREVLDSLRADPFDRGRLAAATRQQAQTAVSVQAAAQAAWLDLVSQMSPDERESYADAIEATLRKTSKKR